jgi:hypothetical protein
MFKGVTESESWFFCRNRYQVFSSGCRLGCSATPPVGAFRSAGLDAHDRGLLFDVQTKAAIVGTIVQLVLGAVLFAAPGTIERTITRLRRDRLELELEDEK